MRYDVCTIRVTTTGRSQNNNPVTAKSSSPPPQSIPEQTEKKKEENVRRYKVPRIHKCRYVCRVKMGDDKILYRVATVMLRG